MDLDLDSPATRSTVSTYYTPCIKKMVPCKITLLHVTLLVGEKLCHVITLLLEEKLCHIM